MAGDDADVDLDRLDAADALDVAFLQHAQDLGLGGRRHVTDLIEENRTAVAQLELAESLGRGAGERAALMAEEFALDQVFRDRRAIDRNEALGCAMTVAVQRAGDQFLAGAALARDHHGGVARGELADDLETCCIGAEVPMMPSL